MTDLDARLAALSPQQRAKLERLLAAQATAETTFPISLLQRGMWFLEQLQPDNIAYLVPGAMQIEGDLDPGLLRAALTEIVRRHESLRTSFQLREGRPVQVIAPEAGVELPELDLRGAPGELEKRIAETLSEPLDLGTAPLLRTRLLRTGEREHVLVLAMHHLVSDRWSLGVFVSELCALYEAFGAGEPSPLLELAIQYGDFATWQQEQLRDGRWDADLAYWRERLAGVSPVLALPVDRPRPAVQGFQGGSVQIELPKELMRELAAVGNQRGATTYMALLAVLQILLHRYCNQDDIVVGMPTAQRGRAEVEPIIGYFVNTLPIRVDLGGDPDFGTVLDRVKAACLGAYEHQEVPFDSVVADLNIPRDLSRPPVYQVSLSYGREPVSTLTMGGAKLRRLPVKSEGARFDLELQAFDNGDGLSGWFEYDRDLFDHETVRRFTGHFRRLVEQVVADPARPVDRLDLLGADELRQVLTEHNATAREWPEAGWLHQCFAERARTAPEAEALRFEGESLSYAELDRRANQLAHRLIRLGVGRDVLVGVAMERSAELVVSLLAVLKAGGAYLPLDPSYPRARLEYVIGDAAAPVLLTQRAVLAGLPPTGATTLCVDELAGELAEESTVDPEVAVDGEDLAYVIYTSGSTGQPKGVANVHAAIRNRLLWMQDAYRLTPGDRVLQKTPFSFDVSVWEFFWPLMTGATLVLARPGGHRDGAYLAGLIRAERITTMHFVPSMLQVFLQEPVADCVSLRRVFCSGEALPLDLQDRFLARSGAALYNLYGPTEAAVDVSHWTCESSVDSGDLRPVPIGFPIANTTLHVLDRVGNPVPPGVAGELHIGGRNLARGYLGRPELTAERFVRDPFSDVPGARLYRTGDLARRRNDGALEFLGRLDHQVKLRGFRIELGEIEAVLTGHPLVREAVLTAREYGPGDLRLVAYLVAEDGSAPGRAELAAHLTERLPEYMVPSAFVVLPEFPLTSSGKVDRGRLPEPEIERPELATGFTAAEGELERELAGLWGELLGVARVGRHDNFFDLGGHSLLMAELRTRLAGRGHELSMVELFGHPTVGSLAAHLSRPAEAAPGTRDGAERAENIRQSRNRRQRTAERRTRSRNDR